MKKLKYLLVLVATTALATAGYAEKADNLAKSALPDLESNDLGTISMSVYCLKGGGND